jgi:hypothetical protein
VRTPEPEYRQELRQHVAKMEEVAASVRALNITVNGQRIKSPLTAEWQPLQGMPGLESRLIPAAFVVEMRGEAGAGQDEVQTAEAAFISPISGQLLLRRLETEDEYSKYLPGQLVVLKPGERRGWKLPMPYRGLSVFIPAEAYNQEA